MKFDYVNILLSIKNLAQMYILKFSVRTYIFKVTANLLIE